MRLALNLLRLVGNCEGVVASWSVGPIRFSAHFNSNGQIETDLPTNPADATNDPYVITLLTAVMSPDSQPVGWAVVFYRNEGMWFKLPAPRMLDDRGLSVAQDALEIFDRSRLDTDYSSALVVAERDVPVRIEDWLRSAYQASLARVLIPQS